MTLWVPNLPMQKMGSIAQPMQLQRVPYTHEMDFASSPFDFKGEKKHVFTIVQEFLILTRKFKLDIYLSFSNLLIGFLIFFFFTDLNVPLFLALMIEKSIAGKWISWTIAKILHFVNLGSVLLLPVYVINVKYEHIGPGKISYSYFQTFF